MQIYRIKKAGHKEILYQKSLYLPAIKKFMQKSGEPVLNDKITIEVVELDEAEYRKLEDFNPE